MSQFDDIRPYNDDEVQPTIERLVNDPELINAICHLRFPKLNRYFGGLIRPVVRWFFRRQVESIESVEDVQKRVEPYLQSALNKTTSAFTFSGLEKLDKNKPYLFVSNHRDIAMDPALVNLILHKNGFTTVRIAIGDNLLTKPFVTDLIRINKSFIVNRSATRPREKLKALKHLSAYIHHSICEEDSSIWIAHREGRAKDGLDITNTAIIGMFALSKPKPQPFSEYINELNIVPVSISYEWDPYIYEASPLLGYLMLLNPCMYITEGLRQVLTGSSTYFSAWICIGMLLCFACSFFICSCYFFKKQMDPVLGS